MTNEIYVKPNNEREAEILLSILDMVGWMWNGDENLTDYTNYKDGVVYSLNSGWVGIEDYEECMNITPIQTALFETNILEYYLPLRLIKLLKLECRWEDLLSFNTEDKICNCVENLVIKQM